MSGETIAIAAVGVALLGVLVPLLLTIRGAIAELRADVGELRRELGALAERVARIEGAMGGGAAAPWAPSPAPPGGSWVDLAQPLSGRAVGARARGTAQRRASGSGAGVTAALLLRERVEAEGFHVSLLVDPAAPRIRVQGLVDGERATLLFPTLDALRWWWLGWWCGRHHRRLVGTPAHGAGGGPETAHGVF